MKATAPPENLGEREKRVQALIAQLTVDVPTDVEERDEQQQARWLLANLLEWHRREDKTSWWEFFSSTEQRSSVFTE